MNTHLVSVQCHSCAILILERINLAGGMTHILHAFLHMLFFTKTCFEDFNGPLVDACAPPFSYFFLTPTNFSLFTNLKMQQEQQKLT